MTGPCRGGRSRLPPGELAGRGPRRPLRNAVLFSLRLERPWTAGPLPPLVLDRDRALIAAVTRVAVASLSRHHREPAGAASSSVLEPAQGRPRRGEWPTGPQPGALSAGRRPLREAVAAAAGAASGTRPRSR